MMYEISLESFQSNVDFAKESIIKNKSRKIKVVEFRTLDEGLCNATYFIYSKKEVNDRFEAFVSLLNYQIHFYEEWKLKETTQESIEDIIKNFIAPSVKEFKFKRLSSKEAKKEIDWLVASIRKLITEVETSFYGDPSRWGIYIDNEKVSNEQEFIPICNSINWAIGLDLEWNSIEIFFETKTEFVLFSWGTGA